MNKNQNINITGTYNPNRNSNLASFLPVGNVNRNTPAYTGAIIGQGLADMANTASSLALDFYEHKKGLEEKIQHTANNNGMMEYQTFATHVINNFKPQVDGEKSKLEINKAINNLKNYSSSLEGLDVAGKDKINQQIKLAQITLDYRQTYGRMELVASKEMAIAKTNFNDAIKSGDHQLVEQCYSDLESKGMIHNQPLEYYSSKANLSTINNNIHNMNVEQLKYVDEELQNVSDNGDGVVYNLKQDDNMRARKMVANAVSVRHNNLYDQMEKLERSGELDFEKVKELYASGDMPLSVLNGVKKRILEQQQKANNISNQKTNKANKIKQIEIGKQQDLLRWDLYKTEIPKNKVEQNITVANLRKRIYTIANVELKIKLDKILNEKIKAVNTPDKSFMNEYWYKDAITLIDEHFENNDFYSDPDGLGNKIDNKEFQYNQYSKLRDGLIFYRIDNPNLPKAEYLKFVNNMVKKLQDGKLKDGFNFTLRKKSHLFNSGARIERNKSSKEDIYSSSNYLTPSYKKDVDTGITEK